MAKASPQETAAEDGEGKPIVPIRPAPELNLERYSFLELIAFKERIDAEIELRKTKEIAALRTQAAENAKTLGISVGELFGFEAGKRKTSHARGKQPTKYQGPNGEEWSGRGPAPGWMKPFLAKGKTKADFLIKEC